MIRRLVPAVALLASACMSVPAPPPTIAPSSATGEFARLPVASIAPVPDDWWRLYDDPVLDGLVRSALAANADLRVAYANLDGARAALRQARATRLPQTTIESALEELMAAFGPASLFVLIGAGHLLLVIFGLIRMRARPAARRTPYVYAPRTSFLIGRLLSRQRDEKD